MECVGPSMIFIPVFYPIIEGTTICSETTAIVSPYLGYSSDSLQGYSLSSAQFQLIVKIACFIFLSLVECFMVNYRAL